MYEGTPDAGGRDRWWRIVEDYKVSILYTAPTTIRTLMKWGEELPAAHDLSSLRLLGLGRRAHQPRGLDVVPPHVGRRALPDRRHVVADRDRRRSSSPRCRGSPPPSRGRPCARSRASGSTWSTTTGGSVGNGEGGYLVVTDPWPGMLRGIWGDPERYGETYWSRFPGRYFAGDGAKRDEDGDLWLLGRVDDVMNISGHRISTTEIEHALVGHPRGGRGGGGRGLRPHHRPGHRGLRDGEGRGDRGPAGRGAGDRAARRWP